MSRVDELSAPAKAYATALMSGASEAEALKRARHISASQQPRGGAGDPDSEEADAAMTDVGEPSGVRAPPPARRTPAPKSGDLNGARQGAQRAYPRRDTRTVKKYDSLGHDSKVKARH